MNVIKVFTIPNTNLGDWWIYEKAISRFLNNDIPFQEYFLYLPSFFLLSPFVYNQLIYAIFLICCSAFSLILLLRLEKDKYMAAVFTLTSLATIFSGNIDVFMFFVILLSIRYEKLAPYLLGFISFKPSVIFILPFFLYRTNKRIRFMFLYCLTILLTNYYFLFNFNHIWIYLNYNLNDFDLGLVFFRPFWLSYPYYYWFMSKYKQIELDNMELREQQHKYYSNKNIEEIKQLIKNKLEIIEK